MANWPVAQMLSLTKPCECGCADVILMNDTGTNEFWLTCADPQCGFDGPSVDLDVGHSLYDLRMKWEAGYTSPHQACLVFLRESGDPNYAEMECAKCHHYWTVSLPAQEGFGIRSGQETPCPACGHQAPVELDGNKYPKGGNDGFR